MVYILHDAVHGVLSVHGSRPPVLTMVGAAHEVLAGILWIIAHHRARDRVEAGEIVSVEAVVML